MLVLFIEICTIELYLNHMTAIVLVAFALCRMKKFQESNKRQETLSLVGNGLFGPEILPLYELADIVNTDLQFLGRPAQSIQEFLWLPEAINKRNKLTLNKLAFFNYRLPCSHSSRILICL